ncbi:MAG: SPOR domain-containing protein [Eubacteriales bacterium]|nr:SPOR domain-containing protein [Eubacteriales bacterium]MDD3882129.1 SPOR domain-containing protein [Eubacteriales bacterium]MDD4513234.1 SPOR domain-containing protein [Eubacteriales bacterium]
MQTEKTSPRRRSVRMRRKRRRRLQLVYLSLAAVAVAFFLLSRGTSGGLIVETMPTGTPHALTQSSEKKDTSELSLPPSTYTALQLGAFDNLQSAEAESEKFKKRGAAGYVFFEGKNRLFASVYPSRAEARNVQQRLKDNHSVETYLYTIELPPITMRVTGTETQLGALSGALALPGALLSESYSLFFALDEGRITGNEAKVEMQKQSKRVDEAIATMKSVFAGTGSKTVINLQKTLSSLKKSIDVLSDKNITGDVEISAQIKYTYIEQIVVFRAFLLDPQGKGV